MVLAELSTNRKIAEFAAWLQQQYATKNAASFHAFAHCLLSLISAGPIVLSVFPDYVITLSNACSLAGKNLTRKNRGDVSRLLSRGNYFKDMWVKESTIFFYSVCLIFSYIPAATL